MQKIIHFSFRYMVGWNIKISEFINFSFIKITYTGRTFEIGSWNIVLVKKLKIGEYYKKKLRFPKALRKISVG